MDEQRQGVDRGAARVPDPPVPPVPPIDLGGMRAPPPPRRPGRGPLRLLYNHNPFYAISALLVLWGLYGSFDPAEGIYETGALTVGMAGYGLLLAAVACLLIRLGQLWEDVRTILVVIVVFLMAVSISLDGTLAHDARFGHRWFLGGLTFSAALSEGVLQGTGLGLPALFRIPYYLILTLFFMYPPALAELTSDPANPVLHWWLFGFTSVAGVVFLSLLPAVWAGPDYVRRREGRLSWPLFPWTLFAVLGAGVCVRAYCLCVSFHPIKGEGTIFAAYFLVPFLLAANVLLLELGRRSRSRLTMVLAVLAPLGLFALAAAGCRPAGEEVGFTRALVATLKATPVYLTLLGAAVFYGWCMIRRVPLGAWALTATLAALCVWGPRTTGFGTLVFPQAVPLALVAAVQLGLGLWRRSPVRTLLALWCLIGAATLWYWHSPMTDYHGLIPLHLALGALLLVGALFRGAAARALQYAGAAVLLAAGVAAILVEPERLGDVPPMLLAVYPGMAAMTAVLYGLVVRNRTYYLAAAATLTVWTMVTTWGTYRQLRLLIAGLDKIALGIVSLLVGLAISLIKLGLPQRWLLRSRE